jgi:hypothetical protein
VVFAAVIGMIVVVVIGMITAVVVEVFEDRKVPLRVSYLVVLRSF